MSNYVYTGVVVCFGHTSNRTKHISSLIKRFNVIKCLISDVDCCRSARVECVEGVIVSQSQQYFCDLNISLDNLRGLQVI